MLLTAGLVLPGCGPSSDLLEVSGKVTLDGVALNSGSIRCTSVGSDKLVASGAMIVAGEFVIPQETGLSPGTYRVEISSPDDDAPPIVYKNTPDDPGVLTQPDRIPPKYNVESDQTIEVTTDGENEFAFDIVTHTR
jgi:hypothetical protein